MVQKKDLVIRSQFFSLPIINPMTFMIVDTLSYVLSTILAQNIATDMVTIAPMLTELMNLI